MTKTLRALTLLQQYSMYEEIGQAVISTKDTRYSAEITQQLTEVEEAGIFLLQQDY